MLNCFNLKLITVRISDLGPQFCSMSKSMPEASRPHWAKDDFNDFSTHHHSRVRGFVCQEPLEISIATPSERTDLFDAQEVAGSVEKGRWALGCPCVRLAYLASMICCVATAYSLVVSHCLSKRGKRY